MYRYSSYVHIMEHINSPQADMVEGGKSGRGTREVKVENCCQFIFISSHLQVY